MEIDLTKLYSELRARGYIRATDPYLENTIREPYLVTPAGVEWEKFLIRKHLQVSARLLKEISRDPASHSVHLAALGALTLHDIKCTSCNSEGQAK